MSRSRMVANVGPCLLLCVLSGCETVREDRTITWSAEGDTVGFQHGRDGVFVADKKGGSLKKVFQPDVDVLATSTPLWAPAGGRMIFATARPLTKDATPTGSLAGALEANPAGNLFADVPVVYTCWLRDDQTGASEKLFEANCDHVGYVAANLAVRWHPDGDHILFIDGDAHGAHGIYAYNLKDKTARRAFPQTAPALVFEWAPKGGPLACVLGGSGDKAERDGLWIGRPDGGEWWHVPDSGSLAPAQLGSLLEQLRATRPAWTPDGTRFAFVSSRTTTANPPEHDSLLRIATVSARRVEDVAHESALLEDLRWSPDGERLGFIRVDSERTLHTWSHARGVSGALSTGSVRRFAGWSFQGSHLAYIVPADRPETAGPLWSFLLISDRSARDAVVIADGAGQANARTAFSGMRVTFPLWSPDEQTLSLWSTFSPTHRSTLSRLLGSGLRPGDPAAILDVPTGALSWMTISPQEEAQVGHYFLLKREYAEAWRRYEQTKDVEPDAPPKTMAQWRDRFFAPQELAVFRFHCLSKLGRTAEARAQLSAFRRTYPPHLPAAAGRDHVDPADRLFLSPGFQEAFAPGGLGVRLIQDLAIAEVLLSVDAANDCASYFRTILETETTEVNRLSAAVVLAQVLLLLHQYDNYATLATDSLAPLLAKLRAPSPPAAARSFLDLGLPLLDAVGVLSLYPLMAKSFVASLSEVRLKTLPIRWERLRSQAKDDRARLLADAILAATYRQLGQKAEWQRTASRIRTNPDRGRYDEERGVTDDDVDAIRFVVSGGFGSTAASAAGGQ